MEYQYAAYVDEIGEFDVALESSDNILVRTWKWIVDKITSLFKWVLNTMAKFHRWLTQNTKKHIDVSDIVAKDEVVTGKPKDKSTVHTETDVNANRDVIASATVAEQQSFSSVFDSVVKKTSALNILSGVDNKVLESTVSELWKDVHTYLAYMALKDLNELEKAVGFGETIVAYLNKPGMATIKALAKYRGTLAKTCAVTDVFIDTANTVKFVPTKDLAALFGVTSERDLTVVHIAEGFIKAGDIPDSLGVDLDKKDALRERAKSLPKNIVSNNLVLITGIVTGMGVITVPDSLASKLEGRTPDFKHQLFNQLVGTRVVEMYKETIDAGKGVGFIPNAEGGYYCFATRRTVASLDECINAYKEVTQRITAITDSSGFAKVDPNNKEVDSADVFNKESITIGQIVKLYEMYGKQLKGVREESRLRSHDDFIKHFTKSNGPIATAVLSNDKTEPIHGLIAAIAGWVVACNTAIMKHLADINTIHSELTVIFERAK